MKNTTKHLSEFLCSSPITCYPVFMPHLSKQIKRFRSHSLIFTIILAHKISVSTSLKCSPSLQCVG